MPRHVTIDKICAGKPGVTSHTENSFKPAENKGFYACITLCPGALDRLRIKPVNFTTCKSVHRRTSELSTGRRRRAGT